MSSNIEAMIVSVRNADPILNFVGSHSGMNDYWLETVRLIQYALDTGLIEITKRTRIERDVRGKEIEIEYDHVEILSEKLSDDLKRFVNFGFGSYMARQDIIPQASLKGVPERYDR